jgi:putative hydrolase of the HAD superfamily
VVADAVIFDLDDTLIIEAAQARTSLVEVARLLPAEDPHRVEEAVLATATELWRAGPWAGLCQELGIASWEGLWSSFEGNDDRLDGLGDWARTYRPEVWRRSLVRLGVDDGDGVLAEAMARSYIDQQRRGHPLIDGAAAYVRGLAEGHPGRVRLGLLTNGPSDIQRAKFEGTGLADCFDTVVVSGEVGMGKPEPAIFTHTLDALGTSASTTVMVGDSWERDVLGALGVGMTAVWVAGGRPTPDSRPGVSVVDRVGELAGRPAL